MNHRAKSNRGRKPSHPLSEVDLDALLAQCAQCGPVDIIIKKSRPTCRRGLQAARYREKYGISISDYEEILSRQGGGCAVCGARVADARGRPLHVDHDHTTGAVRGLLCVRCNVALSYLRDDPAIALRMADYLQDHFDDRLGLFRSNAA